jgi:hypothetical protein
LSSRCRGPRRHCHQESSINTTNCWAANLTSSSPGVAADCCLVASSRTGQSPILSSRALLI